jgi:hypothetical protein
MNKPKALFILSRYKEDYNWIEKYTDNYIVYNKGDVIEGNEKVINKPNLGGNQRDIFEFVYDNYENLPERMIFIQAFPFDHCNEEKFNKIIFNDKFTSLESYEHLTENNVFRKDFDGGYMEFNNSWYIQAHNQHMNQICKYVSFDDFMNKTFQNYNHVDWIRFTPGSQYVIEKKQILYYPRNFWEFLMNELNSKSPTEGHIIERALLMIFKNYLIWRGN